MIERQCPHCKEKLVNPPYGEHFDCPRCGQSIYFSHCWKCRTPIAGSSDNQCPTCKWHYCPNCISCAPDCNGFVETHVTPDDRAESLRSLFTCDDREDDEPGDDRDEVNLEDEIPDACWSDWYDNDPSAYPEEGIERD